MRPEEPKIRALFQRLKREDEQHAPPFARSWAAAQSRRAPRGRRRLVWRLAAAGMVALSLSAAWLGYHRLAVKRVTPNKTAVKQAKAIEPAKPDSPARPVRKPPPPAAKPVKARRQRISPAPAQAELTLLSQWRSPTEFLLHTPGEALLKTAPRAGESLIKGKVFAPEQLND